jgi:hypothetical protein
MPRDICDLCDHCIITVCELFDLIPFAESKRYGKFIQTNILKMKVQGDRDGKGPGCSFVRYDD